MTEVLKLNAAQVLGLACFGVTAGVWLKRRLPIFDRLNVPASILGGLSCAVIALALRDRYLNFELDLVLRDLLMLAFFTTLGLGASLRLIKQGGRQVVWFLLLSTLGAVAQNAVGVALARLFGLSPLLGFVSGSVALTGGPATALAFGATFEKMGVAGATTVGVASAMFGITAGGLLGGLIGGRLIRRFTLSSVRPRIAVVAPGAAAGAVVVEAAETDDTESSPVFHSVVAVAVSMALGTLVSAAIARAGVVLPAYVGAMLVAAVLRNVDDATGQFRLSTRHIETLGNVSLSIFIVMALMTLRLWELVHLAGPILVMLAVQVALVWLLCLGIFHAMGRDYEAAVMSGGFCGFMLGNTANAMACMGTLTSKFGPAPRAYIIVPLVGAFLIDFTNALIITTGANLFR